MELISVLNKYDEYVSSRQQLIGIMAVLPHKLQTVPYLYNQGKLSGKQYVRETLQIRPLTSGATYGAPVMS